ncbi:TlpA family protein disulfide reductase [Chitinophaga costaii]|nr:TlpA family protein disulfide reductase [Chitinophaga costaii]
MLFTSGKENIQVTSDAATFPVAQSFKGDEDARAMQAYQQAFQPLIAQAQALNAEAHTINGEDEAAKNAFRKKAVSFGNQVTKTGVAFVQQHPHNIASIWLMLNELRNRVDPQQMEQLFTSLDKPIQSSKYGEAISQYLQAARLNGINVEAEDFTQNDVNGKPVSLKSFRGKYVLVDFWASWCGPCRQENPNVVAAYQKYKDKNFTVLGISLDKDKTPWTKAIAHDGLTWTQVSDLKGWSNAVAVQYGIQSIPANMLIGPDGKIVARNLRGEALNAKLEELLIQ